MGRFHCSLPVPKGRQGLFLRACSDRTKESGFSLAESRFRLDPRKKFSAGRMVRHWNRFPREAVNVHPWECSRPVGWGIEQCDLVGDVPAHVRVLEIR